MLPTYFDHNASTALDARVLAAMLPYLREQCGNPSSRHEYGREALRAVSEARERVADAVGAHPSQVVFLSGGTEASNLLIQGVAAVSSPAQIAVSAVEHPSVKKPAQALQARGWAVRNLAVDGQGRVAVADLDAALAQPTALLSVMLANNETGVVQDVAALAERAHARGVAVVHTDAVQALGKLPVDFAALGVEAMSLSAHKIRGPKGVGALILNRRVEIIPLLVGGGQEKGLRAGTENVPGIVGFGLACTLAAEGVVRYRALAQSLRDSLESGVRELGATVFGAEAERLPNTSFFAFPRIDGETLVMALDRAGFACASGAACSSGSSEPSPVLGAMGVEKELARCAVRVSLGADNTAAQVAGFLDVLGTELVRMRNLAAMAA